MEFNPYLALAINSFFTGFGVVAAQHVYEIWFRRRVDKTANFVKQLLKKQSNAGGKE